MMQIRPGRLRTLALSAAATLLCLALGIVLFDPFPVIVDLVGTARIRRELPRAIDRWRSTGVSSYRVMVKGSVPLVCLIDGELTVRDGRLASVRMRQNPLVPDSPVLQVGESDWQEPYCSYEDLTVESMFGRIRADVERAGLFGAPLSVQFDEQWGYVTEYRFGRSSHGGIFGVTISECCTWFEFGDLLALDS